MVHWEELRWRSSNKLGDGEIVIILIEVEALGDDGRGDW